MKSLEQEKTERTELKVRNYSGRAARRVQRRNGSPAPDASARRPYLNSYENSLSFSPLPLLSPVQKSAIRNPQSSHGSTESRPSFNPQSAIRN
jgi:hypothetical protein